MRRRVRSVILSTSRIYDFCVIIPLSVLTGGFLKGVFMTEQQRKEMMNFADIIRGEIYTMCRTDELTDLDAMYGRAKKNLDKLHKMIFDSKFKSSNDPNTTYYDRINEFIRRGQHAKA